MFKRPNVKNTLFIRSQGQSLLFTYPIRQVDAEPRYAAPNGGTCISTALLQKIFNYQILLRYMGLDIYVGSYTRYFTGNWENIVQQRGREEGWDVQIIRPDDDDDDDAITDPEDVRSAVLDWRREIETGLGNDLKEPLDWDESDDAPYFTDKPAWDGYGSLLLWAAYSEHPELKRPVASTEDWYSDPAFQKSVEPDFRTSFPSLLRDVEAWLPAQFMFNFKAADLSGKEMHFGSAYSLRDELYHLNKTTWDATEETLTIWRREGAEHLAPLETLARCAFGMFWQLVNDAIEHRLIMKLDY